FSLWFDFDAFEFDPLQRQRAVGHFMALFDAALADLSHPVAEVELVRGEERAQLIAAAEPTRKPPLAEATWVSLFEAQADRTPDALAARFQSQCITYAE